MYFKSCLSVTLLIVGLAMYIEAADPPKNLKCYKCKNCGDPFDKEKYGPERDCSSSEFYCFKYTNAKKEVERGCTNVIDKCGSDQVNTNCHTCSGSKCNSGHRIQAASTLSVLTTFVAAAGIFSGIIWRGKY